MTKGSVYRFGDTSGETGSRKIPFPPLRRHPATRQTPMSAPKWHVTGFPGTQAVFRDGKRKERTDPECAAARREFIALEPPEVGVLRTLSNERFAHVSCWRP